MAVNVKGTMLCCQAIGDGMAKAGRGSIVNICSTYGLVSPDQSLYDYRRDRGETFYKPVTYSASKSAILNLTRYLATYWAQAGRAREYADAGRRVRQSGARIPRRLCAPRADGTHGERRRDEWRRDLSFVRCVVLHDRRQPGDRRWLDRLVVAAAAQPRLFPERIANWIGGAEKPAVSGDVFEKISPHDGAVICRAARSGEADVQAAVSAARAAQPAWAAMPAVQRGDVLHNVATGLKARAEDMARVVALETGKSFKDALGETKGAILQGQFMAGEGMRLYGRTTTSAAA